MSQPSTPSALPSMTPSIQPGQAIVAKPSSWNDAVQSSLHCAGRCRGPSLDVTASKTCLDLGVVGRDDGVVLVLEGVLDLVDHGLRECHRRSRTTRCRGPSPRTRDRPRSSRPRCAKSVGDLVAVGGQTGLLEQVGAVADALGADVGAVADQPAVGGGGGLGLPVEPAALDLGGRRGRRTASDCSIERGEPVDLDRLDVGEARARGELGVEVVLVLVGACRPSSARSTMSSWVAFVLLDELLVAELVEGGDGQRDLAVLVPPVALEPESAEHPPSSAVRPSPAAVAVARRRRAPRGAGGRTG